MATTRSWNGQIRYCRMSRNINWHKKGTQDNQETDYWTIPLGLRRVWNGPWCLCLWKQDDDANDDDLTQCHDPLNVQNHATKFHGLF